MNDLKSYKVKISKKIQLYFIYYCIVGTLNDYLFVSALPHIAIYRQLQDACRVCTLPCDHDSIYNLLTLALSIPTCCTYFI